MTKSFVIGVDAGATSTRVAVHALDGSRAGYARAGAGNPSAHGLGKAVAAIGAALAEALDGIDPSRVVASLAGVAGQVEELPGELAKVWAEHGVAAGPRVTGDVVIAYVAGTPEPSGSLLLSGTGAVAARVTDHELEAIADGLGWLLGDAGSGFWIGRAAAKAVVAALDRGTREGALVELVLDDFLGGWRGATTRADADRIVRLAQADHMRLAALAAPVSRAAAAGDPMAVEIVREAAGHLAATVGRVHVSGPTVLAGSVLTSDGPVRQAVGALLAGREVATAGDGAGAAAWLAARELMPPERARELHPVFTAAR
ncbi:N-acetylglucosamine kinase [Nonomuraea roseoviolacea]|uniref:N-acetylglucosamine kinase-like BadF-type ATPase n=1 Tax=Nonomuraea roseoviolacea subsp. carminata TaxID=160689 RepID=A0ABT1JUC3_9ACTN|nr:BadF/BadG/BcrA/BcrD ATPase family protein [Nonomuraea roseoviolacea]MCP2345027.1 N-acetylglucosamine kinase-like BadF-type ATPase [Nonomuraea roseoviolacea subsp. carminata]